MKKLVILFAGLMMAGISPALAHVTLERGEAAAGSPYKIVLRVPHGCEGSATTKIEVKLPEGIIAAKPMPKPGWQLAVKNAVFARGYAFYHGVTLKEGAREISWSNGKLPDEYYDEFVIAAFVAKELAPGPLYFLVKQTCEKGEADWLQIPAAGQDAHALQFPAPMLNVIEDHGHGHKH